MRCLKSNDHFWSSFGALAYLILVHVICQTIIDRNNDFFCLKCFTNETSLKRMTTLRLTRFTLNSKPQNQKVMALKINLEFGHQVNILNTYKTFQNLQHMEPYALNFIKFL